MPQTVFITGASSGIGAATAQHFLQHGWNVVATMRAPDRQTTLRAQARLELLTLDVTDDTSITAAVAAAQRRFGRIDVLVNNAGVGLVGPLEGVTADQVQRHFATNVVGLIALTREILPIFREQHSGVIVNLSSVVGRFGVPFHTVYCAAKFAVEGLSEALRMELQPFGIRVKLIEPGSIRTRFAGSVDSSVHEAYAPASTAFVKMSRQPNDRLPGPEVVAHQIYRAATDRSRRLRYPVKPGPLFVLHALLPDKLWQTMWQSLIAKMAKSAA